MTVTVWDQAHALLGALLLGMGAGLWYDLLRCLRYRIRRPAVAIVLDLLFWLAVTVAIFLWSITAGDGKVQLSVCAGLFLGGVAYFQWLSSLFFPLLSALIRVLARLLKLLFAPVRHGIRLVKKVEKNLWNFFKNHFSIPGK